MVWLILHESTNERRYEKDDDDKLDGDKLADDLLESDRRESEKAKF